jgi:hypothetical protein
MKPHKGILKNAVKHVITEPTKEHLGYYFTGVFEGHPDFNGESGYISMVVKQEGNEVETLNSRYTLILAEKPVEKI